MADIAQAVKVYNDQRMGLAATRRKAYGRQNWIVGLLAIVMLCVIAWVYSQYGFGAAFAALIPGAFCVLAAFAFLRISADKPGDALQQTMREQVFPALFSNIEDLHFQADTEGFYEEIPDGIKPAGKKREWGDLIEGSYKGQPISINEFTISRSEKNGDESHWVQVFKGIALRIGLDQSVPDLIVSKEGRNTIARWISDKLGTRGDTPHVAFDDEKFEAAFNVHSGDENFARSVFSNAGRAKLMDMQSSHTEGTLRLAATDTTAYILLDHDKNFFELPSLDRPFNEGTHGRELKNEMQSFLDLSDEVRGLLAVP